MDKPVILPPGQHPDDPSNKDIDAVAYGLERVQTFLLWIDEHRSSFEKVRNSDPASAETELRYVEDSTKQALSHLQRLIELLLAGYTVDPNKLLPKGLSQREWLGDYLRRLREGSK